MKMLKFFRYKYIGDLRKRELLIGLLSKCVCNLVENILQLQISESRMYHLWSSIMWKTIPFLKSMAEKEACNVFQLKWKYQVNSQWRTDREKSRTGEWMNW